MTFFGSNTSHLYHHWSSLTSPTTPEANCPSVPLQLSGFNESGLLVVKGACHFFMLTNQSHRSVCRKSFYFVKWLKSLGCSRETDRTCKNINKMDRTPLNCPLKTGNKHHREHHWSIDRLLQWYFRGCSQNSRHLQTSTLGLQRYKKTFRKQDMMCPNHLHSQLKERQPPSSTEIKAEGVTTNKYTAIWLDQQSLGN